MTGSITRAVARLDPQSTAIFCCDMQERFRTAIFGFDLITNSAVKLLKAAALLDVPVFTTEQAPKNLGATIAPIKEHLDKMPAVSSQNIHPKTRFSMFLPGITDKWLQEARPGGVKSVVIFGIESHVCVLQTTLDLLERDYNVHIVADGVSSINREEVPLAFSRLSHAGATITSSESLIFELVGDASNPQFKAVSTLIKEEKQRNQETLSGLSAPAAGQEGCRLM